MISDDAIKTVSDKNIQDRMIGRNRVQNGNRSQDSYPLHTPDTDLRYTTPYERMSVDNVNRNCLRDVMLGRRIGFYRLRGEIGSGNFSQVKLGVHVLTKGNFYDIILLYCLNI